jgi:hypothetical protein
LPHGIISVGQIDGGGCDVTSPDGPIYARHVLNTVHRKSANFLQEMQAIKESTVVCCVGSVGGCGGSVVKFTGQQQAEDTVVQISNPAPHSLLNGARKHDCVLLNKSQNGRCPCQGKKKQLTNK